MLQSNVNFNLYKSFVKVFEERNISKAATVLQITQPTVTYNIKELERQLGIKLFHTHPRGVEPTRDAKELYRHVHEGMVAISNGEDAVRDFTEESTGHIRISVLGKLLTASICKAISNFNKIYPKVTFEVVPIGLDATQPLLQYNTDVSIGIIEKENANIAEIELKSSNFVAVSSRFFAEKHQLGGKLDAQTIKGLPIIVFERDKATLTKLGIPHFVVSDLETMKALIAEDSGLGICLDVQVADIESLVKFDISSLNLPSLTLKCLYNKQAMNKANKTFIETLSRIFGVSTK